MAEKTVVKGSLPGRRFLRGQAEHFGCGKCHRAHVFINFCTDWGWHRLSGILFMVSKLNAITDLVAGYVIDNETRFGKARPWANSALSYCGSAHGCFCPTSWSYPVKAIWVFFMYMLVNSVWATF